jgi:signal transduction histidine kinase
MGNSNQPLSIPISSLKKKSSATIESNVDRWLCFLGFFYFIFLGIVRLYFHQLDIGCLVYLFTGMALGLISLLFKLDKWKLITNANSIYLLFLVGYSGGFLFDGGFLNPTIYLIYPFLLLVIYQTSYKTTNTLLLITFFLLLILFTVNYFIPELINSSAGILHFSERIFSHLFSLVLSFMIIDTIFNKFKKGKLKAKQSEKAKEDFLANMSHLIRTPLNGINGYADLLKEEDIPNFEKDVFKKRIFSNAKELHHMIFNLIDLSIIQENALRLNPEWFLLSDLIQSIKIKTNEEIKQQGKDIEPIITSTIDKPIFLDGDKLFQMIWNFIENSISYSSHGYLRTVIHLDEASNKMVVTIEDSGNGMTTEQLNNINNFNVLDRNQSTIANPTPGMGILISKGIAKYMGGQIIISSEAGKGTHVHIELPMMK